MGQRDARRHTDADDAGGLARRTLVPRLGPRQRPLLGHCTGHQASSAARDFWAAIHVLSRCQQRPVSLERREWRDAHQVLPFRFWADSGSAQSGCGDWVELHPRKNPAKSGGPALQSEFSAIRERFAPLIRRIYMSIAEALVKEFEIQ